jgi:hypothetical protein
MNNLVNKKIILNLKIHILLNECSIMGSKRDLLTRLLSNIKSLNSHDK